MLALALALLLGHTGVWGLGGCVSGDLWKESKVDHCLIESLSVSAGMAKLWLL